MTDGPTLATPDPRPRIRYAIAEHAPQGCLDDLGHWFALYIERGYLFQEKNGNVRPSVLEDARLSGFGRTAPVAIGTLFVCIPKYCARDEARKLVALWADRITREAADVVAIHEASKRHGGGQGA